ncbi:MAG: Lrp/AsnC family transcriptional regulator [Deltaproteobacteria bacterium]|nr:Lrp/AsnC family transcriptional regulator [Deltaproteobacteria bacterium]
MSPIELSQTEKKLIYLLSGDVGLSPSPYAELSSKLGLSEDQVLTMLERFRDKGLIRRLGAIVVHQRSGFTHNALVAWLVEDDDLDRAGEAIAALPYVSHCYYRSPAPDWPYNLYSMIHARNAQELSKHLSEASVESKASDWRILTSLRELKKSSMRYFSQSCEDLF